MSLITMVTWVSYGLALAGALATVYIQFRRPIKFSGQKSVIYFAAIWISILLLEYYILGPASHISWNIDGNIGATFFTYLTERHLGGQVAHGYGGAFDIDTIMGFGTQIFSLERILFSFLPTWFAILVLKIAVAAVGFSGAYRLVRAMGPSGREVAAVLAALFTVAVPYNLNATTWNGLGYAVLPWVLYFAFARADRRYYLPGLVILGVMASTTEPLHTFLSIAAAVFAGVALTGRMRPQTIVLPLVIIGVFMLINWHEVLYALKQIAPLTIRGRIIFGDLTLIEAISRAMTAFPSSRVGTVVLAISLMVLAYKRDPFFWNALATALLLLTCYVALVWLPWEIIGLKVLKGLSPHYLYFATSALMLPIAARAISAASIPVSSSQVSGNTPSARKWPIAIAFAGSVALLIIYKVEHGANFIYYGGQTQFGTIENLKNPDWSHPEPFRVVTLRHQQPEPELAAAFYGFDTYDGTLNLAPAAYSIYWHHGILRGKGTEGFFGRLTMDRQYFSDGLYHIERQANLEMLKIANVAFIISPIAISSNNLHLVSGPKTAPVQLQDGLRKYVWYRLMKALHYGKVYVYALADPLPRVFAAQRIHRVKSATTEIELLKTVSRLAPHRTAVFQDNAKIISKSRDLKSMHVRTFSKAVNGYDVTIDAPDGGVLILNVPYLSFWKATDGKGNSLPISPVNMIHMSVVVQPGTKSVSFRYRRPTLR
ncbi:MAG: hypothetical protein HOB79_15495 [Rhodospirillaceae bacterium]|nr:hypothetical protein [Rhodospirillales bacterium]MBT4702473.1 hypothetical protein [Rhodospirillaceae bacterium]MBT5034808.1 hypothetical protein [Rhodospirillaceae bacterium]MBT6218529.1 hypothetical protein [Rhodospirillaceae bacterium]MBT6361403.1 hypothetical protein [Rhodospirillaceae bacterium]